MKRILAISGSIAILVAACSGGAASPSAVAPSAPPSVSAPSVAASASAAAGEPCNVEFLSVQTDLKGKLWDTPLTAITEEFAKTHPGSTFKVIKRVEAPALRENLQLLEAQGKLPLLYPTPSLDLLAELQGKGEVADLSTVAGVAEGMSPAGAAIVKKLNSDKLVALPMELNIEGIWYNKKIFADNGLQPPTTWDELVAAAGTLKAKGIQPFAASGKEGWPITRLVGNYLFRTVGPDALAKVTAGTAKLTDPAYVAAAKAVADLGAKGYFGPATSDLDYGAAEDLFLTGKAAMFYMGSWATGDFSNADRTKIGEDNIGYIPFPTVAGGTGTADQIGMNAGQTLSVNGKLLTPACQEWLAAVASSYADQAWKDNQQISGFASKTPIADASATVKLVQDRIAATKDPVLWFEQAFNAEGSTLSQTNAAPLLTGGVAPDKFMSQIQTALDKK